MRPDELKWNEKGLIPTVVAESGGPVLMFGWSSPESLRATLESGRLTLWSRSRQKLWTKGETSGNFQRVTEVRYDCDEDALLVTVIPEGPICHTGEHSCFYRVVEQFDGVTASFAPAGEGATVRVLEELEGVIRDRKKAMPEGSYTTKLFAGGQDRILKKVGEEAGEVIIASKNRSADEIAWEAADLLYHLVVLLVWHDLPLNAVMEVLKGRRKGEGRV